MFKPTSVDPQPAPVVNDDKAVWPEVINDMHLRHLFGIRKYGTPLQPFNGRKALVDLYQELLDGAVYVKQDLMEREALDAAVSILNEYIENPVVAFGQTHREALRKVIKYLSAGQTDNGKEE